VLKISYADCLGLSPAISAQFTFEMCVAARNREKFTKTLYFGGSGSFKVISRVINETNATAAYLVVASHAFVATFLAFIA